jgi:hypothetical protein
MADDKHSRLWIILKEWYTPPHWTEEDEKRFQEWIDMLEDEGFVLDEGVR